MNTLDIAASGLQVQSVSLNVTAHNIANVSTKNFAPGKALLADDRDGGVVLDDVRYTGQDADIAREFVDMVNEQRSFEANAAVVKTDQDMFDSLFSMKV